MKRGIKKVLLLLLGLIVALISPALWGFTGEITIAKDIANPIMASDDRSIDPNPQSLLAKGIEAYEAESFIEAVNYWQNANQIFIDREDILSQALAHSYLSLAYQKLGRWQEAETSLKSGQELIKNLDRGERGSFENRIYLEVEAKIFNSQAHFYWRRGELESALQSWEIVIANCRQLDDFYGMTTAKINRAQTLQSLGFTSKARGELEEIYGRLEGRSNSKDELRQQVASFRLLGSVYRRLGMLQESSSSLQRGLEIARKLKLES